MKKLYISKIPNQAWWFVFFLNDEGLAKKICTDIANNKLPFFTLKAYQTNDKGEQLIVSSCWWDRARTARELKKEFELIDTREYDKLMEQWRKVSK